MQIPPTWIETKLGKIGKIVSGGTPSTVQQEYFDGDIPWLTPADLSGYQDKFISHGKRNITKSGLNDSSAKLLPANSILFSSRAPIGYVVIARNSISTNQGFKNLIPYTEIFNEYIYYYLKGAKQLAESMASGTTFKEISGSKFAELPFPLPPLPEQHRIVAKIEELFSDLDAGIASLRKAKEQLKIYRQSVLKWAFEGKLTEAWRKKNNPEPASELLKRIKSEREKKYKEECEKAKKAGTRGPRKIENAQPLSAEDRKKLPTLPDGWEWVRVTDIGDILLGRQRAPKYHAGSDMRPYLKVSNVFENRIDITTVMSMNFDSQDYHTFQLAYGDILLNEGQSYELVGRPAIYRNELPGACFTNTLVRFRPCFPITPEFCIITFLHYLKSGRFQEIATITVNIAHLGTGRFAALEFALPSLAEQKEIVREYDRIISVADNLEKTIDASLTQAAALRQSILKRAFEGKLVPQDPNNESASVLLERIKREREKKDTKKQDGL